MKLLSEFREQLGTLGELRYVWLTSFNINIEFIETYLLPAVLAMEPPKTRLDYEHLQVALTEKQIDFRVFCDRRFMEADRNKRTAIPVHGVCPASWNGRFSRDSLFHPKVIYLEDKDGNGILGTGSANLTVSGWGRNQEVFVFHRIDTRTQHDSVRTFFAEIATKTGLPAGLPASRNTFPDGEATWQFVHSFQGKPFIEQFFADMSERELLVWSPYLPRDIPAFFGKLQSLVAGETLSIHLVPDRIQGKFIRTPWTDALQALCQSDMLCLYDNPTPRHEQTELCHAKVWKLGSKLAIGSWNFTSKGANLPTDSGEWNRDVNVEAGVIITDPGSWRNAVGTRIRVDKNACASEGLLQEEQLDVPDALPFDIRVVFDWREQSYIISGQWYEGEPSEGYELSLPGYPVALPLKWMPNYSEQLVIPDSSALLFERRFEVLNAGKQVFRGLITETGLAYRRPQAFESLLDLLNAFVLGDEPSSDDDIPFRIAGMSYNDTLVEELASEPQGVAELAPSTGSLSYFRLFQATHHYAAKLKSIRAVDELNRWVFVRPGCLMELVEKARDRFTSAEPSLFDWFLAQEVCTLCHTALSLREKLGYSELSLPQSRWDALQLTLPDLPVGLTSEYLKLIQQECHYVDA
ncbi:hypothetical protein [Chitinilyticum aquatile]|uniref:hypothetical protein n=1 Tax=Chitinilyticum aquatile TaxID=362520 RepID=UPI00041ABE3D|nr:hypothetical protein [Chitinilyticum aquatile]